jgi:transposase
LSDLTPKSGHLKKSQYVDSRRCPVAKKSSRIRRTFTPQFKKDAVALVLGGRTVNEVAHDLGIARSLLQRWKTQLAREPELPTAFPGSGRLAPQAEQLRQLQQRLRAVTEERDILKKALAYFADDQK